jgi:ATP-dependent helicase HrpB
VTFDPATTGAQAKRQRRLGAVALSSGQDSSPDRAAVAACLIDAVRDHGIGILRLSKGCERLRQRAGFAGLDALSDAALIARIDDWLPMLIDGRTRLNQIDPGQMLSAWETLIGWDGMKQIDRIAPNQFVSPAGSHHDIDYDAPGGPTVELRVQALFGLGQHPVIGVERVPLILSLTSPAGRPIQTTCDLPGFWTGSWRDVAKEMRGRYPKHPWPDDPAAASATLRTKRAGGGGK